MSSSSRRDYARDRSSICYEYEDADDELRRVKIDPSGHLGLDDIITEQEVDGRSFGAALPEQPTPSSDERYRDSCGTEMPVAYCANPEHADVFWGDSACRTWRCQRCWESGVFHRSKSKLEKLEALHRYRKSNGKQSKRHHLTISVQESIRFDSGQPLDRLVEVIKEILMRINVDTGYLLYHPYRIKKEYRGAVQGHDSGEGDMTWKDIYPLIEEHGFEHVRDEYLTYAPHFHVICLSEFVQGGAITREIQERAGLLVERITVGDSAVSIEDLEAMCSVMMYALSHVGLEEKNGDDYALCRPFGEVANFEAYDRVCADVDEAMREVVYDVLGVDFPNRNDRCQEHIEMEASETTAVRSEQAVTASEEETGTGPGEVMGALHGAGGGGGEGETRPVVEESVTTEQERPCWGKIKPISMVEHDLDDDDWRADADQEAIDRLYDALETARRIGDDLPPPV